MAMYLIQNGRKHRVVSIFGRILASTASAVDNKPGQMWLTEEEFSKGQVQDLLSLNRITLVKVDGEPSASPALTKPAPKPSPVPEPVVVKPAPKPEPVVEVVPEPVEVVPEPVEVASEPEPAEDTDSSVAVVQEDGDIVPLEEAAETGKHVYTESELSNLTLPYIRPICKKIGIDFTGMRKSDIIQAILDSQES